MKLYWVLLIFFGPEWIDMEVYVCTWEYALFPHGLGMVLGGLVWFQTVPWVCTCFLCILNGSEIRFTSEMEIGETMIVLEEMGR